jgi:Lipopolysaccharide export system permease LptF/LptG
MIPGQKLHRLATRICSAKTLERVVEPAIADLQKEYCGVATGRVFLRAWILFVGYCAALRVMVACALSVSIGSDAERRALVSTLAWSVGMLVVIAVLLILPPFFWLYEIGEWYAVATVVPQTVPLAIPLGVAFGMAFGLCARPTVNTSKVVLVGALAASVLSFAFLAWGMPAGNQAFRQITFRALKARGYQGPITIPKGHSEMTLSELRGQIAHFSAVGEPRVARQFVRSFHLRFSIAAATLALASVLLAAPVNHRGLRGLLAFTVCFGYWVLMFAGDLGSNSGYVSPPVGAWLPNIVFVLWAFVCFVDLRGTRYRKSLLRSG